ncbi:MAG TPA: response regulator [Trichocoleus sp.]|jgi:chemosensory pili system protein ChpA (sensor histidine kinase/response regulator)
MLSEQQQRIMGYFIEEAKDHLNTIEQGLIDLKATIADPEMVTEVFRAAHSVKGGAAMLGLSSIQQTAHRLEDYFKVLKECTGVKTDQKLETLFLRVFDTLQELLEQLQGPFGLTEDKAAELMAAVEPIFTQLGQHLNSLVSEAGVALPEDVSLANTAINSPIASPAPRATQPTINREESALQLIFQSDVPAHLRDMLQLFKQPDNEHSRQQLQDLCQVMAQPGEQLELTNWCDLLEQAWLAVGNLENSYRSLAPVLIKEIKSAQELVLAGRSLDITPSQALLDLLPPEPEPVNADLADLFGAIDDQSFLSEDALIGFEEAEQPFSLFDQEDAAVEDWFTTTETQPTTSIQDEENAEAEDFAFDIPIGQNLDSFDVSQSESGQTEDFNFDQFDQNEDMAAVQPRRTGPAVGSAELNSLADLFDGEGPDLGEDWSVSDIPETAEMPEILAAEGEFSDLLFEPEESDDLLFDDGEEDLSGLLNSAAQQAEFFDSVTASSDVTEPPFDDFGTLFDGEAPAPPKAAEPKPLGNLDELFAGLEMEGLSPAGFSTEESFEAVFDSSSLESLTADSDQPDNDNWEVDLWGEGGTSNPSSENAFDDFSDAFNLASVSEPEPELFEVAAENVSETEQNQELFDLGLAESTLQDLEQTDSAELFDFAADAVTAAEASESSLFDLDAAPFELDGNLEQFELAAATEPEDVSNETSDFDWLETSAVVNEPASDELVNLFDAPVQPDNLFEAMSYEAVSSEVVSGEDLAEWSIAPATGVADLDDLFGEDAITVEPPDLSAAMPFELEPSEVNGNFDGLFDAADQAEQTDDELSEAIVSEASELPQELDTPNASSRLEELAELTFDFEDSGSEIPSPFHFEAIEESIDDPLNAEMESPFDFDVSLFEEAEFGDSQVGDGGINAFGAVDDVTDQEDPERISSEPLLFAEEEPEPFELEVEHELNQPTPVADTEALNFADFDALSELEDDNANDSILSTFATDDFSDLESMLAAEPISTPEDEFSGLESMLTEEPISAPEDDFSDLELMLAEEPISTPEDEFSDLELMLAEEPQPPATEVLTDLPDEFADLEALLEDIPAAPPTSPPITSALPATRIQEPDDEFGDLEALLKDADQTLGVGSSPTRKASSTTNRRSNRRNVLSDQTMRVSVKHLDSLNNLVGEMVVNRNSLEQAQERLRQFLDNLLYQVQQLSDVGQRMRDLYERSLLERSLLSSRRNYHTSGTASASSETSHATGVSFDALEIDQFTAFHTLSQEMIELIVRVRESASDIDFVVEESDQVTRNFRQITTQLQEGLTRARMVPFSQTADRLPRGVRDNSLKYGKQAELIIEGRDTLIDKMIVEQLYDPMTHLVNNAIAHGIETPEERIAAGKSPTGRIIIRTFHQGNQTVISVSDDGAGIDSERVKSKAVEKGLLTAAEARDLSRLDVYDLLFHHGFSTVDKADDLRGRGVGLDVVRNNLNEIRGAITIDSAIGKGTTFTIRLPLTLSISKALCCISNRARIAFPMDGVEDMLDVPKDRIQIDEAGQSCIYWRDMLLPFQPLSELLRYNRVLGRGSVYGGNQEEDIVSVIVLRSAGNFLALQVDQVLGEQEIVIKQLEGPVPKPLGVAGATVQGDGRIMPIADVLELIDLWEGRIRRESGSLLWDREDPITEENIKTDPTVLIVDDSITVRELLSMTFNKIGYRVEQARDGQEAWEKLRAGLPCDLVFCDIEMPRMDGLELLSRIQKDPNLNHLPIAMLTSRGADRHRQMAVQLGAKGYFTKPYLEEALLDAAQRMLKGEVLVNPGTTSRIN